jgi:hypothetical protein
MLDSIIVQDNESVATKITSNTVNTRRKLMQRWGPPVLVFTIATFLIRKDSSDGKSVISSNLLRSYTGRRELYSPYDKSTKVELPAWTNSLANVWDPLEKEQTPFFWFIPKAGGTTISDVFSNCLGLTLASNKGMETGNQTLSVHESASEKQQQYPHQAHYVNVKTNNEKWIEKCKERGLLESGLADVFATQHMTYAAQNLFTENHQGRGFVMMRHPVKRVIDQFLYRQQQAKVLTEQEPQQEGEAISQQQYLAEMSLEDFIASNQFMNNFEVRMLNGITDFTTPITDAHVAMAKEILRRKFVVGIFEWFDVGMVRFEKYFGWWKQFKVLNNLTINNCHYSIIESGDAQIAQPKVENVQQIYAGIMSRSWADVELYHYARTLFADQAKLL